MGFVKELYESITVITTATIADVEVAKRSSDWKNYIIILLIRLIILICIFPNIVEKTIGSIGQIIKINSGWLKSSDVKALACPMGLMSIHPL